MERENLLATNQCGLVALRHHCGHHSPGGTIVSAKARSASCSPFRRRTSSRRSPFASKHKVRLTTTAYCHKIHKYVNNGQTTVNNNFENNPQIFLTAIGLNGNCLCISYSYHNYTCYSYLLQVSVQ